MRIKGSHLSRLEFAQDVHFNRLVHGDIDRVDLATVALEIARDEYPDLKPSDWLARLDWMGEQVQKRVAEDAVAETKVEEINRFLFEDQGYRGNSDQYYDARNSFLNLVIERKLGIPITLSLVYLAIANRIKLPLRGVAMPGHFLVKYVGTCDPFFIDPFHRGEFLTRDGCESRVSQVMGVRVALSPDQLEPATDEHVTLRLLGNLKAIYVHETDLHRAVRVQERICTLRCDANEFRDLGVLYLRNGRPGAAIEHLERFRDMSPESEDSETAQQLLEVARKCQASLN